MLLVQIGKLKIAVYLYNYSYMKGILFSTYMHVYIAYLYVYVYVANEFLYQV